MNSFDLKWIKNQMSILQEIFIEFLVVEIKWNSDLKKIVLIKDKLKKNIFQKL